MRLDAAALRTDGVLQCFPNRIGVHDVLLCWSVNVWSVSGLFGASGVFVKLETFQ